MELETVGRVSMGNLSFEIGGQVDDRDGTEGAFLGTDTTANAQSLGDEGNFRVGGDLDTELAGSHDGAGFLAFLATFLEMINIS